MSIGIYRIEIKANNGIRVYVGQAEDLKDRRKRHFTALKGNRHFNVRVQNCYNKYGEQNCQFIIQESTLNEDKVYLAQREQHWKDYWVDEIGEKNVLNLREIYPVKKLSKEALKKMSGENHHNSVLDWNKVKEIRELYKTDKHSQYAIAKIFDINQSQICQIVSNKAWIDKNYSPYKSAYKPDRKFGEDSPTAKLNWEQVNKIRELYQTNKHSQCDLSKIFNICQSQITRIVNNQRWYDKNYVPQRREYKIDWMIGEKHPQAKLTKKQAIEIRKLYKSNNYSHYELSKIYGISRQNVGDIINNKRWRKQNGK